MSQLLIVFSPSGDVHYQYNNKIIPFNELVASLVNLTVTEVDPNFFTTSSNQKRFYAYHKNELYAAVYFDLVTTIDNEKIRQTLSDILKTYTKLTEDLDDTSHIQDKLKSLIDYQFNQLTKLETQTQSQSQVDLHKDGATKSPVPAHSQKETTKSSKKKKMRKWVDGEMVEDVDSGALDFSEGKETADYSNTKLINVDSSAFKKENDVVLVRELQDIIGASDDEEEPEEQGGFLSKVSSYFGSLVNIDEISKQFTEQLISKNVAPQTAKSILERIKLKLKGKKVDLKTFKQTLTDELTKILSPNVSTDLLYDIKSKSGRSRPYVISVVGVNGVGKSTNLAKLAYWFLQNDLKVLICACDTFRSGAVEQLKVHVRNLKTLNENLNSDAKIDIFEKGYGGGDHVVATAKAAIQHGAAEHYDIILIDTAGRTHSNAKLMAPLKKFGDAADPDKIIMVGEALVGTDSVEQATNFNNAFGNRRSLDFFIISKVDTVGELVGTMINMVMATNVPILFIGTGQTYTDIKRLNVRSIVDSLMRG